MEEAKNTKRGDIPKTDCEARRLILQAAKSRFLHYGYKKTTIDEIAADAGVGKGSVYLHFCSKEEILQTLARETKRNILAQMQCISDGLAAPEEKLRRMIAVRVVAFHDALKSAHGAELVDELNRPQIKVCIQAEIEQERQVIGSVLRQGISCGDFSVPDNDVEAASRHMMLAFLSFAPPMIQMCHGDTQCVVALQKRAHAMLEFLLHGIRVRNTV